MRANVAVHAWHAWMPYVLLIILWALKKRHRMHPCVQVGIQPDVLLDAAHMPPSDGPGFCRFIAGAHAPPLFGSAGRAPAAAEAALVASR